MKNIFKSFIAFAICLIFVGCPSDSQHEGDKTDGIKIKSLQSMVDDLAPNGDLDLSTYNGTDTYAKIEKTITIKNGQELSNVTLDILAKNVNIKNCNIKSVNTNNLGNSSLKIVNSKLSTLSLDGNGATTRGDEKDKISLVGSVVNTLDVNAPVQIDIQNFTLGISAIKGTEKPTFNLFDDLSADISSWFAEIESEWDWDWDEDFLWDWCYDDIVSDYEDEGVAGQWLEIPSFGWPEYAVSYVADLIPDYMPEMKGKIPEIPTLFDGYDLCTYFFATEDEMEELLSSNGTDYEETGDYLIRCISVNIPKEKFNIDTIKELMSKTKFDLDTYEDEDGQPMGNPNCYSYVFEDKNNDSYSIYVDIENKLEKDEDGNEYGVVDIFAFVKKPENNQ